MTLGETREQISTLENELSHLKEEKHQLFLQLKKVLNEDDKRQRLIKETRLSIIILLEILFKNYKIYIRKSCLVFVRKF